MGQATADLPPPTPGAEPVYRVVLVDDHGVVRAGLRLLLERGGRYAVVGVAGDARTALREVRARQPDLIVLDVTLPDESGIGALPKLLAESPASRVVMLSMHEDPHYVRAAFAAGASAYVVKEAADTELVEALERVLAGGKYVNSRLGARLATVEAEAAAQAVEDPLSQREHEVLRLIALGHTNQEIAGALFISVRTAETHRAHLTRKLGLSTRAELVRYALARGLLGDR